MLKTFTFVRMQPGLSRDEFFRRWCAHTQTWDLRDHPEIRLHRLTLVEGEGPGVGVAENHWENRAALEQAIAWYATPEGRAHWEDLASFMDVAHSPTVVVTHEALVSEAKGVELLASPPPRP